MSYCKDDRYKGFLVRIRVGRCFEGHFTQGVECAIDSSPSETVVDASSNYCKWYSSTALSSTFPVVSAIGTMSLVLDSNDLNILFARGFI